MIIVLFQLIFFPNTSSAPVNITAESHHILYHNFDLVIKQDIVPLDLEQVSHTTCRNFNNLLVTDFLMKEYLKNEMSTVFSERKVITLDEFAKEQPHAYPIEKLEGEIWNGRIENKPFHFSNVEIQSHDVYNLGRRQYEDHVAFQYLLYAPPRSGKSSFNRRRKIFLDTDTMFGWPILPGSKFIITNMPNLIPSAKYSIAILPSRKTFAKRCRNIKGFNEDWYTGVLQDVAKANLIIATDEFIGNVRHIDKIFEIHHNNFLEKA